MTSRFKITAAAAALLVGTGFAYAQGTGTSHEGASGAGSAGMQQSSPSSEHGGAAQHMNHATQGMGSSQSEEKSPAAGSNQRAEEKAGTNQRAEEKSGNSQRAEEKGDKSKSMSSENETKGGNKEMKAEGRQDQNSQKAESREDKSKMKAEGREDRNNMKAEGREDRNNMKAEGREDKSNMKAEGREDRTNMNAESKGTEGTSRTVGQAGAGAKLSTEQRTKITSVIKNEHVASVNNVNFSVSVGTRVPHDVAFHPLPADVVSIYPEWRGYNFILVRDEIVVIDPSTYEIVAVINS